MFGAGGAPLTSALAAANLKATVDPHNGDIILDSTVFFDTAKSTIKEENKAQIAALVNELLA